MERSVQTWWWWLSWMGALGLAACQIERTPGPTRVDTPARPQMAGSLMGRDGGLRPPMVAMGVDAGAEVPVQGTPPAHLNDGGAQDAGGERVEGGAMAVLNAPMDAGPDLAPDGGELPPKQRFGLTCGGAICRSVTAPAAQCCTAQSDVQERRAGLAGRCGIALSGRAGCAELEQLGALDGDCPSQPALAGDDKREPGCCSTTGRCGSFDSTLGLGCHENPGVDLACGSDPQAPMDEACEATGVFAIRADVDVVFGAQTAAIFEVLDAGRGDIQIVLRAAIEEVGADGEFVADVTVCDIGLPSLRSSLLCERYAPGFDPAIFDAGEFGPFPVTGRYQCQAPGCLMAFDATTRAIGITLDDPDAPWPVPGSTARLECESGRGSPACFPDVEGDGQPGITMRFAAQGMGEPDVGCGGGYRSVGAPLSANPLVIFDGVVRADRVSVAVRTRLGAAGVLTEACDLTDITGFADFINARAMACRYQPGSSNFLGAPAGDDDPCTSTQAAFMDQNLPEYQVLAIGERPAPALGIDDMNPSSGPRFDMVRVGGAGEAPSCADIRAAVP